MVTVLLPCKVVKPEFLKDALDSVIGQTAPDWLLIAIIDRDSPDSVKAVISRYLADPRVRMVVNEGRFLAGALNTGMRHAETEFICILLGDDRLDADAISTLKKNIRENPGVDFFHSSRAHIDSAGKIRGDIMPSKPGFALDYFKTNGSPVKHLLCWRRLKGLDVGGMNEETGFHGPDDYDFPWTMAEAGCSFKAIPECLYYYRIHHETYRLTTDIPLHMQVEALRKIFKRHNATVQETESYVQRALDSYLTGDRILSFDEGDKTPFNTSLYREFTEAQMDEFEKKCHLGSDLFTHRVYYLPRPGPDQLKLAMRMCKVADVDSLWEILLFAEGPVLDEFPGELFFDDDVVWHRQHHGRDGHIAFAYVVVQGDKLYGLNYVSDVFQRISRRRGYKTRIEKKFKGWHHMLFNSIMAFALAKGVRYVYSPSADFVMKNSDPTRNIRRELFDRVYDNAVSKHYNASLTGDWWVIDVKDNMDRVVLPLIKDERVKFEKTICVCHDIERGIGHFASDPTFSKKAEIASRPTLGEMLRIEAETGVKATYNVLGCVLNEVRGQIEAGGHCVGFHSFDHNTQTHGRQWLIGRICRQVTYALKGPYRRWLDISDEGQLVKCRAVDYRLSGYRPPQSKITPELCDLNLAYYNFDWLASSHNSLGFASPRIVNGIVKIPILFDDYDLHTGRLDYAAWECEALESIRKNDFVAFGLHDCYGEHWLPHYREFLAKILRMGSLKTLDEVSSGIIFANGK
jgi:glycosyltransferase involved in cell wall biosynthesis